MMNDAVPPTIDRLLSGSFNPVAESICRELGVDIVRLSILRCKVLIRHVLKVPFVPIMIAGVLIAAIGSCEALIDPGRRCIDDGRTRTQGVLVFDFSGGSRVRR